MDRQPWYLRTYLWGQVNLTENDPRDCDIHIWKDYWKKTGVEGVVINCGGIVSYYQSRFTYQYRARFLGKQDYFGVWNQAAREAGLTVIARMDINCTSREMYQTNPEWYCRDKNGKPILSQERYMTCVNGGYYQEFVPQVFQEIIEKYHPDGFADNSWAGAGIHTICYCENCKRLFREKFGMELPERADWEDPVYRKWVRWNYDIRVENWKKYNQITEKAGGPDCKWMGMINADPFATGGRFYDIKRLIENSCFVFCDHQSRDEGCGFEQNAWNGMLLHMAGSEDMIAAESMAHYYKGLRTFRLASASRQEIRKWMLCGMAGGLSPWFHFVGGTVRDLRRLELTDDRFRFAAENRLLLNHRRNAAQIGVLWNQETAVYYGRDDGYKKSKACFQGVCQCLSRAGLPFIPVHADDVSRYRDRLTLLIAPNVAILTEQQEQELADWVRSGKNLILTDETGLYDEEGIYRGPGLLYRTLGIEPEGRQIGAEHRREDWKVHDAHTYFELSNPDHPVFQKLAGAGLIGFGGQVICSKVSAGWEMECALVPAFPIYPPEFSWIREPAVQGCLYTATAEQGNRLVYLPADLDRCYALYHIPDHRKLLEGVIRWARGDEVKISCRSEYHIHISAYYTESGYIVHLVNLAGCNAPLGAQEEMIPVGPVSVMVKDHVTEAEGLMTKQPYQVIQKEDGCIIQLPILNEGEVLKIICRA